MNDLAAALSGFGRVEPALDRLRGDARFGPLLELVHLPPAAATKTPA